MKNALVFLSLFLLVSCSVQKRKYQKGFYVNRFHHNSTRQNAQNTSVSPEKKKDRGDQNKDILLITGDREQLAASGNLPTGIVRKKATVGMAAPPDSCDVLLFKDGTELLTKVFEIGPREVKYKRCDNQNGPSYVTLKEDLFMVKYANGTKEVMKSEPVAEKRSPVYEQPKFVPKIKTMQPLAPYALAFGALGVILSFLILVTLSSNNGTAATGQGFVLVFLAALLSSILAIILGSKAHREIKNNRDVYKGKGLAVTGKILGISILGYWLLVLLLVLLILLTI